MFLLFLNLILLFNTIFCFVPDSNESDFDPIIYYLLNGNETELSGFYNTENDLNIGGEPLYSDGIWKCGTCDNITEKQLIYSETNEVDTNILDEDFLQVQVGFSFDEMRCITIESDDECSVARASGDCVGPTVTLIVADTQRFIVRVFGE
ncbi:PREDICTED: uncharacterized protein LOC106124785 [Papilio xuthus]|uniref:Uncharacterized protein LOC106124785 n=1 Tax=Papilio xuthus TaxID=66420 RepID=A0AAJ7EH56_PAPXU|nr:PREDICTED: uncharacterized protein LOC106124785 [Papilio xuthus]